MALLTQRPEVPGMEAVRLRRAIPWSGVALGAALFTAGLARRERLMAGLGAALASGSLTYRLWAGDRPLGEKLGLTSTKGKRPATSVAYHRGVRVEQAVTINKPAADLYRFWRNLENLPQFIQHLETVEALDERRSRWTARGPAGTRLHWEAEIINEVENEVIGWWSLPGAEVDNAGSVRFRQLPGARGTEVRVTLKYDPPAGKAGIFVAKLLGRDAQVEVRDDLRRLKALLEAGEVPSTAGQPPGERRPLPKALVRLLHRWARTDAGRPTEPTRLAAESAGRLPRG